MFALETRPEEMDLELARLDAELVGRWRDLPRPIVGRWSEVPVLTLDRGKPWLVGPAERDPLRNPDGRAVLPRRQRTRLRQIHATGVRFDRLAVAHELDPSGPVRPLLPLLQHGPRPCSEGVARRMVGRTPPHPGVDRVVRGLDAALAGAGSTAGRALEAVLDPIVFGVVAPGTPRPGEPCLWYPLLVWRW